MDRETRRERGRDGETDGADERERERCKEMMRDGMSEPPRGGWAFGRGLNRSTQTRGFNISARNNRPPSPNPLSPERPVHRLSLSLSPSLTCPRIAVPAVAINSVEFRYREGRSLGLERRELAALDQRQDDVGGRVGGGRGRCRRQ